MKIHFLNTRLLVDELAQGQVDERSAFYYFLANNILWTLNLYYGLIFGAEINILFAIEIIAVVVISVIGLKRTFDANGGPNGRDYILRATCLLFPIGLKITAVSIALGWINYYVFPIVIDPMWFRDPDKIFDLIVLVWSPVFTALLFWRLRLHITAIYRKTASNNKVN